MPYQQLVIAVLLLCGWFFFANFILLQLFIALINENFTVDESEKRQRQLEAYQNRFLPKPESFRDKVFKKISPYGRRWVAFEREERAATETSGFSTAGLAPPVTRMQRIRTSVMEAPPRGLARLKAVFGGHATHQRVNSSADVSPLQRPASILDFDLHHLPQSGHKRGASSLPRLEEKTRTGLGLRGVEKPSQAEIDAEHVARLRDDPEQQLARFINRYPNYDRSMFLFTSRSRIRRTCQSIVPCAHGKRLFGREPSRLRYRIYQCILAASIIATIVLASFATPAYRTDFNGLDAAPGSISWFDFANALIAILFAVEFVLKIIADGLLLTPTAYLLSGWNLLDLFVLVTWLVTIFGGDSRFARAANAFRALRLINILAFTRRTFMMMTAGVMRIVDAAVLAILYIIPFAVWGQNLFAGLLYSCNDSSSTIMTKLDCSGVYQVSPVSNWTFLAPRVWANPTSGTKYSFDTFRASFLVLFEIVSLEGWTSVLQAAMSITGKDQQLQTDASQTNAIFFLIYNLVGAVIVLTLFVSIIIENFRRVSGAAFLTSEQQQWIDLKRLIYRQAPSRRPPRLPTNPFRLWCYKRAINKQGWWSRSFTLIYILNTIALMIPTYDDSETKYYVLRECCRRRKR